MLKLKSGYIVLHSVNKMCSEILQLEKGVGYSMIFVNINYGNYSKPGEMLLSDIIRIGSTLIIPADK